jgi:hypothetical protein
MTLSICVYCGSRPGNDPAIEQAAQEFGAALAQRGWQLVYGGGNVGLMGALARSALGYGGNVVGIIPQGLLDREQGLVEASELIVTDTLRQRKALMDEYAHAFVALPGGFGTFEETIETLTLRQLGYHDKPIIIINLGGYYDPLIALFDHAVVQGYVSAGHTHLYDAVSSVAEAVALLEKMQG